ncbi:hypothetical protein [Streptomyces stelliscabiei]|uniref:Uncharacterized protein n=1 Tax=Streptomyces stelliscabiei TaxID=146820 RepID=A0A8I0P155_9ACTN|nr:hypothetical protein [Streptomyces stelliscabiei]MBE1594391.1 hypothetical protein [Streptomyces stelliscabiei]
MPTTCFVRALGRPEISQEGRTEVHHGRRKHGHDFWYYLGESCTGVRINTPVVNSDGRMTGR